MNPTTSAIVGLAVYLLGLAAAFGWQTFVHWRATGSTGYRGISGRLGSLHWWGGILFVIALILGAAAPVLTLTGTTIPGTPPSRGVLSAIGLVIAVAGIGFTLAAQRQMGTSWRIGVDAGERTSLVTDGLFAYVRNPIFTGMLTVTVGLFGMVPTVVTALALLCLFAAVQIQVRAVEEPYLVATHGPDYLHYASHAGRVLPRLGRLQPQPTRH